MYSSMRNHRRRITHQASGVDVFCRGVITIENHQFLARDVPVMRVLRVLGLSGLLAVEGHPCLARDMP